MPSFNKVILVGNLTRDPELKYTRDEKAYASFGLAINSKYKKGDQWIDNVCYVDITVWDKTAEACNKHIKKGSPVLIEGRLNFETWEADGGGKRHKLTVTAHTVQFLAQGEKQTDKKEDENLPF